VNAPQNRRDTERLAPGMKRTDKCVASINAHDRKGIAIFAIGFAFQIPHGQPASIR
jgi:hypothetical protein